MSDLGWHLGLLLRAYHAAAVTACGELPHGHRGYTTLGAVIDGSHPSQLALATHLGIDRTVMTYLVDDLVAAGLVRRQPNPTDRRQRRVVATPAGVKAFKAHQRQVRRAEDSLLSTLEPAERDSFRDLLRRVAEGARSAPGDPCEVAAEVLRS